MTSLALSMLEALEAKLAGTRVAAERSYLETQIRKLREQIAEADRRQVKNPLGMT